MTSIKKFLKNGDSLQCSQGASPAPISITNGKKVTTSAKAMGNKDDGVAGTNIPLFGNCKILTANAGGTPTTCVHSLAQWADVKSNVKIGGVPCLLTTSSLACAVGGQIKPA